jgi:biotin carboxyl carrier protein
MDLKIIQDLIDVLKKNGVKNFSVKETNGQELALEFSEAEESAVEISTEELPQASVKKKEPLHLKEAIKAEMVGTVYLSVAPNKPKFVEVGTKVQKGQTLCLIEAMKTYFEVKSTLDGTVEMVHVEDREAVDFGRALFSVV